MKQVTTLLPDPIAQALSSYIGSQNAPLTEDLIINTAIEQFLIRQGFLPTFKKRLILTPEAEGSGYRTTPRSSISRHAKPMRGVKQDPVVIGSIDYSECVEICALLKYKDSFFLSRISDLF